MRVTVVKLLYYRQQQSRVTAVSSLYKARGSLKHKGCDDFVVSTAGVTRRCE